jgi:flavodoxin/Pyruvate/2-oxoacid:ferredoxin oxidoreductase delta subunit
MAKAAVIYFSQNGTTARVADAIAAGLRSRGYLVDLSNLRNGPPGDLRGYDLLGFGSPVYYYRLPFNVADYLQALPRLEGVPAFRFLVHGSHAFDAVNSLQHALAARGARDVGYFHCFGEAYFLGHLREGYLFSADHPSPDELGRATAFGLAVAQRAADGKCVPTNDEPRPPLVYRIERGATSRWLVEQVYSRLFKVDPDRCTACGLCMDVCPTKNIERDERGQPLWGRHCLYCLSCEMKCPEDAIASAISRPVFRTLVRPFLRYNVGHWAREVELDHVRVNHRHGRTERLDGRPADRVQI